MFLTGYSLFSFLLSALFLSLATGQTLTVPSTEDVDEDAGTLVITVTHDAPVPAAWVIQYKTVDDTAVAGSDFTLVDASQGIVGASTFDISIPIISDTDFDPSETFFLEVVLAISPPVTSTVTITINDDERIPVSLAQPSNITTRESMGNVSITLRRNDSTTHDFNVTVNTVDMSAIGMDDFTILENITVQFDENEMDAVFEVHIIDDVVVETKETFAIVVSGSQIESEVMFYVDVEDNDTPINYHCGRGTSQPCFNGGTCVSDTGICDCPAEFEGVNCAIETANITTGCGCVNGTCVTDGEEDFCICDPGYAGELCDEIAYFHQCTATGFSVCITPHSVDTFNGDIYVMGMQAESDCNLSPASTISDNRIPAWCQGYAAHIDYNGTCGEFGPTTEGEITSFVLGLNVIYSSYTWRYTDEEVTFTCQYSNGSLQVGSGPTSINNVGTSVQRENKGLVPASLTVTDTVGSELPDELNIGTNVKFCVSVAEVPAFNAITIDRIVANNTRSEPDLQTLTLYDRGCVPDSAVGIVTERPYWAPEGENHTMCFNMDVFIFRYDSNISDPALGILIDFNVNPDPAETTIYPETCSAKRRKRSTETGEENTMGTTFYLINPEEDTSERQKGTDSNCTCSQWLTPALIGLGTVCITLLIIIVIMTVALFRGYREKRIP